MVFAAQDNSNLTLALEYKKSSISTDHNHRSNNLCKITNLLGKSKQLGLKFFIKTYVTLSTQFHIFKINLSFHGTNFHV